MATPSDTAGMTGTSSWSTGPAPTGSIGAAPSGGHRCLHGGGRRSTFHQGRHLIPGQRAGEVGHGPTRPKLGWLGDFVVLSTNWRFSRSEWVVVGPDVDLPSGAGEAFENSLLVVLGLQTPHHPGSRVGHRFVVEVDRVLGGQDHPTPWARACLRMVRIGFFEGGSAVEARTRTPRPCRSGSGGRTSPAGSGTRRPLWIVEVSRRTTARHQTDESR